MNTRPGGGYFHLDQRFDGVVVVQGEFHRGGHCLGSIPIQGCRAWWVRPVLSGASTLRINPRPVRPVGAADPGGGRSAQRRPVNGCLTGDGRWLRGLGGGFRSRVIGRGCVCARLGVAKMGNTRAKPTSRDIRSLFMMGSLWRPDVVIDCQSPGRRLRAWRRMRVRAVWPRSGSAARRDNALGGRSPDRPDRAAAHRAPAR